MTILDCFEQVASLQDFGAPGADLENILYLRTVADADRILQSVKKLQSDGGKVGYLLMLLAISSCFPLPFELTCPRLNVPRLSASYAALRLQLQGEC